MIMHIHPISMAMGMNLKSYLHLYYNTVQTSVKLNLCFTDLIVKHMIILSLEENFFVVILGC
jgi:hypothetical protein